MAISIYSRPGSLSWTGNAISFIFVYSGLPATARLQVQLLNSSMAVLTEVIYALPLGPVFVLNIQDLVAPLPQYKRPTFLSTVGGASQACEEDAMSIVDYTIAWRAVYTGSGAAYNTEPLLKAIRGGMGDMTFSGETSVNRYTGMAPAGFLPPAKNFLTWVPSGRFLRPDEFSWLAWVGTRSTVHALRYEVFYLNGSISTINRTIDPVNTLTFNRKFYIPIGVKQCTLDPANLGVAYYDVVVNNGFEEVKYRINVDNLPRYNTLTLYYRNSFGGWDNIAINGSIERSAEAERSEAEYARTFAAANGTVGPYTSSFRPRWKGVTGYLTRQHCTALLDLVNSTECALLVNQQWLPVKMLTKNVTYHDTKNSLHSVQLEFEAAGSFNSFPAQLLNLL